MVRALILVVTLILSFGNSYCQKNLKFDHIIIKEEPFHIYDIKKDSQGFIWLATLSGIYRYDGINIINYPTVADSITNNIVTLSICEDSKKILWFASHAGLLKLDPQTGQSCLYRPHITKGINYQFITSVIDGGNGILWIASLDGFYKFNTESKIFTCYSYGDGKSKSILGVSSNNLYKDSKGIVWISTTTEGLICFNPEKKTFNRYIYNPTIHESISSNEVHCVKEIDHELWISTSSGLNKLNQLTNKFSRYYFGQPILNCGNIECDKNGSIWLSTVSGGLIKFQPGTGSFQNFKNHPLHPQSLQNNVVYSCFLDNTEILWIGTLNGLDLLNLNQKKFNTFCDFYVSSAFEAPDSTIWFGSDSTLSNYDIKKDKYISTYKDGDIFGRGAHSLIQDQYGVLWFNVYEKGKSLRTFEPRSRKVTYYKKNANDSTSMGHRFVWTIYQDRKKNFWIGGDNGVYKYDFQNKLFTHYFHDDKNENSLSDNGVGPIYETSEGLYWIGTVNGLNLFNPKTKKYTHYFHDPKNLKSISNNQVTSIFEDSEHDLWIGTARGLNKYNPKKDSFTRYKIAENLIYSIMEDRQGNLWMSTNHYLIKFHKENGSVKIYDARDGLPTVFEQGNFSKGASGNILYGTNKGFVAFHPDSIKDNKFIPPVIITDFQIFNRSVMPSKEGILQQPISQAKQIIIPQEHSYFSFEFIALNYILSEKNQYAYMLEGFDRSWHYSGSRRSATYSNLGPGNYTFKVKGSNNDGVWNENPTMIRIYIPPMFWQTWWFRILAMISSISLIAIWYKIKTENIKKRNAHLQNVVQERTAELAKSAAEIERMNLLLKEDNTKLKHDVQDLSEARVMQKTVTFDDFKKIFPDEKACFEFLYQLKNKKEFVCKKCGSSKFTDYNFIPYSRRCTACRHVESVTAYTIFHGLKFSVVKAFYILFLVSTRKNITSEELAGMLDLNYRTCWKFKGKIATVESFLPKRKNKTNTWEDLILLPEQMIDELR